jgi:glycosyltransferase involved in cell wall biosynthesis
VSRVSHEKNLEAFCEIHIPGYRKILVGDGPYRKHLESRYPDVCFTGVKTGEDLAKMYAQADVFVFPSKTDTFGVVMIESMATGTPVAAFPVTGPLDVIEQNVTGYYDSDLTVATRQALFLPRSEVYEHSKKWSWAQCAAQFIDALCPKEARS